MAKNDKTEPAHLPTGALVMPDLGDFQAPRREDAGGPGAGRVHGLDYDKWAVALIDLNQPAERVAGQRARIKAKGYLKADGLPIVDGWLNPEVWVIPRPQYEDNLAARSARIRSLVSAGQLTDSAVHRETLTQGPGI